MLWLALPIGALALLVLSHQTLGPVSIAAFFAGWLALGASWPVGFWRVRSQGWLAGRRANLALALTVSLVSLQALISLTIGMRGEFHRAHSHRDDNVAFHPTLGHAPILLPDHEAAGLVLDETVGQRLRRIDPTRDQIVIIGDSVLHGWRLEDHQVVDSFLAPRFPEFQVLNISVSGYSIAQYYLYLKAHLHRTRPRVVVVGLYAGNDYESSAMANWSGHSTPLFVKRAEGITLYRDTTPRFNCIDIVSGSLLYKPLWQWFDLAMASLKFVCNVPQLEEPEHGEVVAWLLKSIEAEVQRQGATLLYVLLPDANDFDLDSWYVTEKSRLPRLRELLDDGNYTWVDFFAPIAHADSPPKTFYLKDDSAHLNESGMQLLAATLIPHIEGLLK